jgi:fatty acid desaturase
MLDHQTFLAGLEEQAKASLTSRSDAVGLWHLAGHWGAILIVGTLIALQVPGWWFLLPLQGVLLIFLFTLLHETTHQTPFANTRLNELVGRVCGFLLILPLTWFRYFHLAHHRWTNIPGKDPELDGEKPATRAAFWWHVTGLPVWWSQLRTLWALVSGGAVGAYVPASALPRARAEARVMAVGYAFVILSVFLNPLPLWAWLLPIVLGQPFLRLYLLAEHGDCPEVTNMFENTRTTFTTAVMRFLAWNMPFHTEHHVYPAVPFHKLPALHGLMKDELRVTAEGYGAFAREFLARR